MRRTSLLFLVLSVPTLALATEEGEWVGYDSIVKELSASQSSTPLPEESVDPFDTILLHAGAGLVTSHISLSPKYGSRISGFMNGFEANLGIDLFSRHWIAEGSVRTFGSEEITTLQQVSLQEFDLKLVYQTPLARKWIMRAGTGLAARYLKYKELTAAGLEESNYSTPAGIMSVNLSTPITKSVSLGADLGYRWALIDDSIDRSSLDGSLRIDAHF